MGEASTSKATTSASTATAKTTASTAWQDAKAKSGGGLVYLGVNADGTNKTETQVQWRDRWFKMTEAQRQQYVNMWAQAGIKTDVINGVDTWIAYGKKSATIGIYNGFFTPKTLMNQDVVSATGSGVGSVAFTEQDANSLIQNAYQSLLGRDANNTEYGKALGLVMGQAKQTGASGRQQSVIDYIKNTQEYDAKMENKYLDAMYNAITGQVQAAQA